MNIILIIVAIGLFFLLIPFIFPSLSPIPYFPTNKQDVPLVLNNLRLQNNQVIFDLGAGDGLIIFKAAKKTYREQLNTQFIAVEINPILIFCMHVRRYFHPNKKNIIILWKDMFKINYSNYIDNEDTKVMFYLYISPWFLEKTTKMIKLLERPIRIVSYFYPIHSLKNCEKKFEGVNKIYNYLYLPDHLK